MDHRGLTSAEGLWLKDSREGKVCTNPGLCQEVLSLNHKFQTKERRNRNRTHGKEERRKGSAPVSGRTAVRKMQACANPGHCKDNLGQNQ